MGKEGRKRNTRTAHTTHTEKWKRVPTPGHQVQPPRPPATPAFQFKHSHKRSTGFSLNKKQVPLNKEYFSGTMGKALSLLRRPRQGSGPREAFGQEGLLGPGGWAPGHSRAGRAGRPPSTFSPQTQAQPRGAGGKINSCWFWFKKQNSERKKEQISRNNSHTGPEGSLVVER